ncbi:MAG TPA: hypothetical protein VGI43_09630 [Mucilaginibacter sp.]|jgi:hypothetical protein
MNYAEAETFHSKTNSLKPVEWQSLHFVLPVKYYKNENFNEHDKTYRGLSRPIFLNKEETRVIIGEYFTADVAFGRGDLLLCEFKMAIGK